MTRPAALAGRCSVADCPHAKASWLGVCAGHWERLPPELRSRWQQAWYDDGRMMVWLAVRRSCLDHLAGHAG